MEEDENQPVTFDAGQTEGNGSVRAVLGAGVNYLQHDGLIDGNLLALSKNPNDVFAANGVVNGFTRLFPGGQR